MSRRGQQEEAAALLGNHSQRPRHRYQPQKTKKAKAKTFFGRFGALIIAGLYAILQALTYAYALSELGITKKGARLIGDGFAIALGLAVWRGYTRNLRKKVLTLGNKEARNANRDAEAAEEVVDDDDEEPNPIPSTSGLDDDSEEIEEISRCTKVYNRAWSATHTFIDAANIGGNLFKVALQQLTFGRFIASNAISLYTLAVSDPETIAGLAPSTFIWIAGGAYAVIMLPFAAFPQMTSLDNPSSKSGMKHWIAKQVQKRCNPYTLALCTSIPASLLYWSNGQSMIPKNSTWTTPLTVLNIIGALCLTPPSTQAFKKRVINFNNDHGLHEGNGTYEMERTELADFLASRNIVLGSHATDEEVQTALEELTNQPCCCGSCGLCNIFNQLEAGTLNRDVGCDTVWHGTRTGVAYTIFVMGMSYKTLIATLSTDAWFQRHTAWQGTGLHAFDGAAGTAFFLCSMGLFLSSKNGSTVTNTGPNSHAFFENSSDDKSTSPGNFNSAQLFPIGKGATPRVDLTRRFASAPDNYGATDRTPGC